MPSEVIFVSAVSDEFQECRKYLKNCFSLLPRSVSFKDDGSEFQRRRNLEEQFSTRDVRIQDDHGFKGEGGTTLDLLHQAVSVSDLVIHLVGNKGGGGSREGRLNPYAIRSFRKKNPELVKEMDLVIRGGWDQITYTQFESYLAIGMGKNLYVAVAKEAPKEDAESQILHLSRLKNNGVYPHIRGFTSPEDLANQILSLLLRLVEQPFRERDVSRMPETYGRLGSSQDTSQGRSSSSVFGRAKEREWIDQAWESQCTNVLALVAKGGVGKSTLVMDWLSRFDPEERVSIFAFSFYHQGQSVKTVDSDSFLNEIADYFEIDYDKKAEPYAKGQAVARGVMRERSLVVLDGLEPLQEASTGRFRKDSGGNHGNKGKIRDNAAKGFIETLAEGGKLFEGLCILTSRIWFPDFDLLKNRDRFRECFLEGLKEEEGAEFLFQLGVKGTEFQRRNISAELGGHALTLLLTGTMIRDRYQGKIVVGTEREGGKVMETLGDFLPREDLSEEARRTFRALARYEEWFSFDNRMLELELMRIVGLFDRAAEIDAIKSVRKSPMIKGLTEELVLAEKEIIGQAWGSLEEAGLVTRKRGVDGESIDAHPLIRQYFSERLKRISDGGPFHLGHERLFRHYSQETPEFPSNHSEMASLYRTIGHCCLSGRFKEALDDLVVRRAWRCGGNDGFESDEQFYSTRHLGMISADFVALCQFFEGAIEDIRVSPQIRGKSKFTLLRTS